MESEEVGKFHGRSGESFALSAQKQCPDLRKKKILVDEIGMKDAMVKCLKNAFASAWLIERERVESVDDGGSLTICIS